jgi:hypothetical protein
MVTPETSLFSSSIKSQDLEALNCLPLDNPPALIIQSPSVMPFSTLTRLSGASFDTVPQHLPFSPPHAIILNRNRKDMLNDRGKSIAIQPLLGRSKKKKLPLTNGCRFENPLQWGYRASTSFSFLLSLSLLSHSINHPFPLTHL